MVEQQKISSFREALWVNSRRALAAATQGAVNGVTGQKKDSLFPLGIAASASPPQSRTINPPT
jgi:hypothetical protein